jgi:hypothetical protein
MALILRGKTTCPLCSEVISDNNELVATSHFIADCKDPLWRFSDAAMHKGCFLKWDQRQLFIKKYNGTVGSVTWGNGTYHQMNDDGMIVSLKREDVAQTPRARS